MQETMHDIFDVEFAAKIEEVAVKVWSELPQALVQKMVVCYQSHWNSWTWSPTKEGNCKIIEGVSLEQESCSSQRQPR